MSTSQWDLAPFPHLNIAPGDLVKIRNQTNGKIGLVIETHPTQWTHSRGHMLEVVVLSDDGRWTFLSYELEKLG